MMSSRRVPSSSSSEHGLGPTAPTYPAGLPLPTTLPAALGHPFPFRAADKQFDAYMFYTSALQVQAILPSNTPVGERQRDTDLQRQNQRLVHNFSSAVAAGDFHIELPGLRHRGGAAWLGIAPILLSNAAHPGETVVLYGTGLGPITTPDNVAPGSVQVGTDVIGDHRGTNRDAYLCRKDAAVCRRRSSRFRYSQ